MQYAHIDEVLDRGSSIIHCVLLSSDFSAKIETSTSCAIFEKKKLTYLYLYFYLNMIAAEDAAAAGEVAGVDVAVVVEVVAEDAAAA